MKIVFRLARCFLWQRPARLLITVASAIASTCLVLWMVSGYEALLKSHDVFVERALGRYTLSVDAISRSADRYVQPEVVTALLTDKQVTAADPMWAKIMPVITDEVEKQAPPPTSGSDPNEMTEMAVVKQCLMLATDSAFPPFEVKEGSWESTAGDKIQVALSSQVAKRFGMKVGSTLKVGRKDNPHDLYVKAIIDNPPVPVTGRYGGNMTLPSPSIGGIYISMADAEKITKEKPIITFVGVVLGENVDVHKFRFDWGPKLSEFAQPAQFQRDHDLEEQLDEAAAAKNMKMQAIAGTLLTMILAFMMIFNTLNMGVSEQIRQLAMLRAIVLTKAQVAVVIFTQAFMVAFIGLFGGLGIGYIILQIVAKYSTNVLRHNPSLGVLSVFLAFLATLGGAFLAAIIPAWRSTRVKPIEAMSPAQTQVADFHKVFKRIIPLGVIFVALAPISCLAISADFEKFTALILLFAIASSALGFILLTAPFAVFVEKVFGPVLAKAFFISPKLLKQQLSCQLWRTVSSVLALSLGLTLFISIQVWGYTLLENFVPGKWAPNMIVEFGPKGIDRDVKINEIPGIYDNQCSPLVIEQPRLRKDLTGSAKRATVTRQDNIVIVGVEPEIALNPKSPMLDFEYIRGDRASALEQLKAGNACIVPEHFLHETGLNLGDSFELVPPENPSYKAIYKIAASVKFRGWHWQTKSAGLRTRAHRAAAMIIADYDSVAKDFAMKKATHFWLNHKTTVKPDEIVDGCKQKYMSSLHDHVIIGKPKARNSEFVKDSDSDEIHNYVQAVTAEDIRRNIRTMAKKWLWAVSILPFIAMVIGGLGVFNVILSSIQARKWELGVLRAIGFKRGEIVRMIIAEGFIIGLIASLLSFGFGIISGWCGTTASTYMSFFGGMKAEIVLPYFPLAVGIMVTFIIGLASTIIPAIRVGRIKPIKLLQDGRNSF